MSYIPSSYYEIQEAVADSPFFSLLKMSDEEDNILKGDAIGDTLYSEKWLLTTLMKLTEEFGKYSKVEDEQDTDCKLELDEDFESDLCILWDMTTDKEVAQCLTNHDFLSLAKLVIETSRAPRLDEIIIGMLANMCCFSNVHDKIVGEEPLLSLIIDSLINDDVPTIIQSIRLLDTLCRSVDNLEALASNPKLWFNISFILENSTNDGLLCSTATLVDILISKLDFSSNQDYTEDLPIQEILSAVLECTAQLRSNGEHVEDCNGTAIDMLISSLYHLSRLPAMRQAMSESYNDVRNLLSRQLQDLVNSFEDFVENIEPLASASVQVATLCYNIPPDQQTVMLLVRLGLVIKLTDERCSSHHSADYEDAFVDCLHRWDTEDMADILGHLGRDQISYVRRVGRGTRHEMLLDTFWEAN